MPTLLLKKKSLKTIEGRPPDLSKIEKGCSFAKRCPWRCLWDGYLRCY
ncbi:MAG: hypothetical protein ACE5FU_13795 [Nitrospinota bacterium]